MSPEGSHWEDVKPQCPATQDLSTKDSAPNYPRTFAHAEPASFFGLSPVHDAGLTLDMTSFTHPANSCHASTMFTAPWGTEAVCDSSL